MRPPYIRAPEKGRRSTSRNLEERCLEQGHLLRASFPKARSMLPADRAQQEKKWQNLCVLELFLSSLARRPCPLRGRGARRPPPKLIAQRGCPILCSLPAGDPRSVWPAAPGIPSLPLRCKPLVPPSQFDPAEYDVIPHGAKSLGHGYRGFTSP